MGFLWILLPLCTLPVVFSQNYTIEDKILPLVELNRINLKYLSAISVPEAAAVPVSPYHYLGKSPNYRPSNYTFYKQFLLNGISSLVSDEEAPYDKCADDFVQILFNLNSQWALQMLDSSGKLASGLLLGSLSWPGNYRECGDVYSPLDTDGHGNFHGRYCVASWNVSLPEKKVEMQITSGICVPDSCENENVTTALRNVMHLTGQLPILRKYRSVLSLSSIACKSGHKRLDAPAIVFTFVLCLLLFPVLLGSSLTAFRYFAKSRSPSAYTTLLSGSIASKASYGSIQGSANAEEPPLDPKKPHSYQQFGPPAQNNTESEPENSEVKRRSWEDVIQSFCIFTNGAKLLNVESGNNSKPQLQSLHGVRFLSLTWVILGHTYITAAAYISNKLQTLEDLDSFIFQMVLQSPFSVDSFFILSGLLLTFLFLKEADRRSGHISWLYFYLHRLWRLTPLYLLIVAFYILLFKYTGSGPFWDENHGDSCRHTWWYYLLYINNFIPIKQMCVGWSWYLANDMQFYVISPLFLYLLWRWPRIGISVVLFMIVGNSAIIAALSSAYDITPFLSGVTEVKNLTAYENKMWDSFDIVYDKPYCRIGPYLVGVLCGYLLHRAGNRREFLHPWQQLLGWALAVFCSASVIFGLYHAHNSTATVVAYNALSRIAFSIGLSWMIFACETGHGGLVYKLLSFKLWSPLSRLTYCAYLVHPLIIHGYYMGLQTVMYFTHMVMVVNFLGFLLMSYVLAFMVSVCFESPMLNIEKLVLKRKT